VSGELPMTSTYHRPFLATPHPAPIDCVSGRVAATISDSCVRFETQMIAFVTSAGSRLLRGTVAGLSLLAALRHKPVTLPDPLRSSPF
jgi:hypothetical protein